MSTDHEAESFYSELPTLARDSIVSEGSESEIDEFILTEMCKEVAAVFGGTNYDSENFEDYDNYAMKDRASKGDSDSIKSSAMIEIVRKSLAGVVIEGVPAIDRFSMSLENAEEQRKLLEYFKKAKMEKDRKDTEKAEEQEAERIRRQEQDRKEREERAAKAKKEKEEKERKEKARRERRERRKRKEKEERERKERKEREAKEKAEREAKAKAEREAKERAEKEQREREQREMQALEEEHSDMIEVAPGLTLPLLSRDATLRALARKDIITATCFICQQKLTAPSHVDFIVCCDDWICMAVEGKQQTSSSSKRYIGFGIKDGK